MTRERGAKVGSHGTWEPTLPVYGTPGRQTLTQMLPGDGNEGATHTDTVQQVAARGVAEARSPLPHGQTIQALFGRHDVSQVRAEVGGAGGAAARQIGARAYATGDRVAFAEIPTLHTAAHEAAHVVQQRAGVSLKGGVGQAGDAYEQHADRVADLVVAGQSAESTLDQMAGQGSSPHAIQQTSGHAVQRDEGPDAGAPTPGSSPAGPPSAAPPTPGSSPAGPPSAAPSPGTPSAGGGGSSSSSTGSGSSQRTFTWQTMNAAPEDGNLQRSTIAVGEGVNFSAPTAGRWQASRARSGHDHADGDRFTYYAPPTAGRVTITFTPTGGRMQGATFSVRAPESVSFHRIRTAAVAAAGVYMDNHVHVHPRTVSFHRVAWKEEPSGAEGRTGYFRRGTLPSSYEQYMRHTPGPDWMMMDSRLHDEAGLAGAPQLASGAWADGAFHWTVPNQYSVHESGTEHVFTRVTQSFRITADGSVTVTKGTESHTQAGPGGSAAATTSTAASSSTEATHPDAEHRPPSPS